jgi:hypothetical protein
MVWKRGERLVWEKERGERLGRGEREEVKQRGARDVDTLCDVNAEQCHVMCFDVLKGSQRPSQAWSEVRVKRLQKHVR